VRPPLPLLLLALLPILALAAGPTLDAERILWNLDQELRGRRGILRDRTDQKVLLSETATLALELALLMDDREGYLRERSVIEERFLSPTGLLHWRLVRGEGRWCSNASVDDLRAVRALLGAHQRWEDPRDLALGLRIGRGVLDHNVRDGMLVDAASWRCGRGTPEPVEVSPPAEHLTLAFADLEALRLLGEHDPRAKGLLSRTRTTLLSGTLHPDGPRGRFFLTQRRYLEGSGNPIEGELQLLQLLLAQPLDPLGRVTTAELCARGDDAWRRSDNIAHVALASRRLARCGQARAAEEALSRVAGFELDEGPHAGLLGYRHDAHETVVWSFDVLMALIASEEARLLAGGW
jgi:hypothetical protein